tara:strand:+ start:7032 stop:7274 length:243 start_codon:yes stop_codon:yes gene_type:complete
MADKYTKKAVASPEVASAPADAWKDSMVEKEHQPAKQKSDVTYRQMENEVANIDAQTTELASRKTTIVAEMAEIKKAVEA